MTFEHDPDLAADLRSGVGREWAEEAAEDERLTATQDRRRFDMATLAKEMVNRADRVTVVFAGQAFSGRVVAGGADHVSIEGSGQRTDVRLDAGYWSFLPSDGSHGGGSASDETMRARLANYADKATPLRLILDGGELVIGRVAVVAADHVEMLDADDRTLYVPAGLILAIVRSSELQ